MRLDAAQYFKNADVRRGCGAVARLLRYLQETRGANAVELRDSKRSRGRLCTRNPQQKPSRRIVEFSEIRSAFEYAARDCGMLVGNLVVYRATGWPMGGSHSEPATLLDSGLCASRVYKRAGEARRPGWTSAAAPRGSCFMGLQHVDDFCLFSRVLCPDCIVRAVGCIMPPDLQLEEEERGEVLDFLHVRILCGWGNSAVVPRKPNVQFALGRSPFFRTPPGGRVRGRQGHATVAPPALACTPPAHLRTPAA